ncbi:hypothetical protein D3C84_868200 [compost metagenome]
MILCAMGFSIVYNTIAVLCQCSGKASVSSLEASIDSCGYLCPALCTIRPSMGLSGLLVQLAILEHKVLSAWPV